MQRENSAYALNWCDKTMTLLRERQLEAWERRLSRYPDPGLFSGCTLLELQHLWDLSYYAKEPACGPSLITLEKAKERVLRRLPKEVCFLSVREHALVERLLMQNGEAELYDWEEAGAAEALVQRLWCTLAMEGDAMILRLPEALHMPLIAAMDTEEHAAAREMVFRFDATMQSLLYITGFLHVEQPLRHFMEDVARNWDPDIRDLAMRFLQASFEYIVDFQGNVVLVHPGLADLDQAAGGTGAKGLHSIELSESMMLGGMNGILPEEIPLHSDMVQCLKGALRPEYTPDEAAEDLRMLAKQQVSLADMEDVLSTMLSTLPTRNMREALMKIKAHTPCWAGLRASLQH